MAWTSQKVNLLCPSGLKVHAISALLLVLITTRSVNSEVRKAPPKRWITVELKGTDDTQATVYFRDDNLYLLAFANANGEVYCMKGSEDLFPGATSLPFFESYSELTNTQGHGDDATAAVLEQLPLGKAAALVAVSDLSHYEARPAQAEAAKRAILTLSIALAGALKIKSIGDKLKEKWEDLTTLSHEEATYLLKLASVACLDVVKLLEVEVHVL